MKRGFVAVLLVTAALVGCTGGGDDDGLPADTEASGWTVSVTYPNGTQHRYEVTSDPTKTDTDGDGVDDFQELQQGADPRDIDTDHDRLLDGSTQCPDSGSALEDEILDRGIIEHPDRPGCYLGESRTEIGAFSYRTVPTDAHSDSSPQVSDTLDDGTEIVGWQVELANGTTYHVRSDPGLQNADTDRDGLHDGLEKRLNTDPTEQDTDGDGVNDQNDAAPLGDLTVVVTLRSIDLETDYKLDGGADLVVEVASGETSTSRERGIESGNNELGWTFELAVSDEGSGFSQALEGAYAAGNWEKVIDLQFYHDGDEPIEVRSGDNGHVLQPTYDAFPETWSGHAADGTSSGPDASVEIDISSRIE